METEPKQPAGGVGAEKDRDSTRRSYDRLSAVYDLLADASERAPREAGLGALSVERGEHVLEIGFGTGHGLVSLARAVGEEGSVVGLDLSPGMREVAARRLEQEGFAGRIQLDLGDACSLPYRDGSFDAVFTSFTLELFDEGDSKEVLSEVARTLQRPGRLGVVSLSDNSGRSFATSLYKWLHRHFPHFVDCEPIDVVGRLKSAGFEICEHSELGLWGLGVAVVIARPS